MKLEAEIPKQNDPAQRFGMTDRGNNTDIIYRQDEKTDCHDLNKIRQNYWR